MTSRTTAIKFLVCIFILVACGTSKNETTSDVSYNEPHRPQIHFSPQAKWMNDPNGMVYYNGTYHLFYQYYPDSTVWGPMHWGHATSQDLVHWKHLPIALYPDSLGYIFSGSAVADLNNTSGLGKDNKPPLVAIFTHHDPLGADAGKNDYQNQSIAYSVDDGETGLSMQAILWSKIQGLKIFATPK
jgi:fructan beta-fructosidase